jgi:RNA-directed DNA polymerase
MDFTDFFPSITEADVSSYLTDRHDACFPNWIPDDETLFCELVCRNGQLTIGAPTSPALSNVICFRLDEQLLSMAARLGAKYTRYADDLFFSTNKPNVLNKVEGEVATICLGLPYPRGLRVNPAKTRHSSKRGRRRVTGLTLGSDGLVHVGRELKRSIRARIHRLESLSPEEQASLAGSIAYVVGMEPDFLNSLVLKYGLDRVQLARTGRGK